MKRIKFKWGNIALLGVLLLCAYIVLHDFFIIAISPFITKQIVGWSCFGLITFGISFVVGSEIVRYFVEEIYE